MTTPNESDAVTTAPEPVVGGIYSVFQNPDLDALAGSQPIAVPNFDYAGNPPGDDAPVVVASGDTNPGDTNPGDAAPVVAAIDLTAAAAEENPSER